MKHRLTIKCSSKLAIFGGTFFVPLLLNSKLLMLSLAHLSYNHAILSAITKLIRVEGLPYRRQIDFNCLWLIGKWEGETPISQT